MPLVLGLGAAGGVGYYLYNAGGNAKAAENKFESTSGDHSRSHCFLSIDPAPAVAGTSAASKLPIHVHDDVADNSNRRRHPQSLCQGQGRPPRQQAKRGEGPQELRSRSRRQD